VLKVKKLKQLQRLCNHRTFASWALGAPDFATPRGSRLEPLQNKNVPVSLRITGTFLKLLYQPANLLEVAS